MKSNLSILKMILLAHSEIVTSDKPLKTIAHVASQYGRCINLTELEVRRVMRMKLKDVLQS
jgi:hypothetical protein